MYDQSSGIGGFPKSQIGFVLTSKVYRTHTWESSNKIANPVFALKVGYEVAVTGCSSSEKHSHAQN